MDLDTGTVQTYSFKSHAEKTLVLQAFKNLVQNTGLVPVVSDITSVDRETICYTLVLHLANLHHATILTYFAPLDNILSEHTLGAIIFLFSAKINR